MEKDYYKIELDHKECRALLAVFMHEPRQEPITTELVAKIAACVTQ